MRKIVLLMHTSLDGFVAGPQGQMDWIIAGDEMFDIAGERTDEADTALYGRVTSDMMEGYWPTAGDQPNATKHSIHHSAWYNKVEKVVVSKTLQDDQRKKRKVLNSPEEISLLKHKEGKDILIIGSPSVVRALIKENLVDDYWLFVNPIIVGTGIPLFDKMDSKINLKLESSKVLSSGVVCLHYSKK